MSCLIIKNDGIGDLILSSGLIRSVGEHFKGNVDLVTCSDNQEIAEGIEPLRERFYVSRDGMRFSDSAARMGWLIPRVSLEDRLVLRSIDTRKYEMVICLRRFIRQSTLIVMRQVRAKKKFCAWELPTNASWSMAERATRGWKHHIGAANVLSELSYNKAFLESVFNTAFTSQPHLSFCQKQTVLPTTRRVALGLGGGSTNWHHGNWIELAVLLAKAGWSIVLLGGNNVADLAEQIMAKVPDSDNLVGQLTWRKTAKFLANCEGYIGNDTGLSHFASLVVQKCVVILGGGTFRRFFPWPGAENQHVIFHGLSCYDCYWICRFNDRRCLTLVRPKDVLKCFEEFVWQGASGPMEFDLNPVNEQYETGLSIRNGKTSKAFVRL